MSCGSARLRAAPSFARRAGSGGQAVSGGSADYAETVTLSLPLRRVFSRGAGRIEDRMKLLSNLCFILGLASVLVSIGIWYYAGGQAADFQTRTHGELFGIFVGLWAPTFLILSNRLSRYASSEKKD